VQSINVAISFLVSDACDYPPIRCNLWAFWHSICIGSFQKRLNSPHDRVLLVPSILNTHSRHFHFHALLLTYILTQSIPDQNAPHRLPLPRHPHRVPLLQPANQRNRRVGTKRSRNAGSSNAIVLSRMEEMFSIKNPGAGHCSKHR
jgi:hypothetical protein